MISYENLTSLVTFCRVCVKSLHEWKEHKFYGESCYGTKVREYYRKN